MVIAWNHRVVDITQYRKYLVRIQLQNDFLRGGSALLPRKCLSIFQSIPAHWAYARPFYATLDVCLEGLRQALGAKGVSTFVTRNGVQFVAEADWANVVFFCCPVVAEFRMFAAAQLCEPPVVRTPGAHEARAARTELRLLDGAAVRAKLSSGRVRAHGRELLS